MRINQVPSCCGAAIIHDLNSYPEKAGFEETLKKKISDNKLTYSQFTIILNHHQEAVLGKVVRKLGFVPVSSIVNNRGHNRLHTYILGMLPNNSKLEAPKIASLEKDFVVQPAVRNSLSDTQKADLKRRLTTTQHNLNEIERAFTSK